MGLAGGRLGDGDERSSLGEVDGVGRGDVGRRDDGWAGGRVVMSVVVRGRSTIRVEGVGDRAG